MAELLVRSSPPLLPLTQERSDDGGLRVHRPLSIVTAGRSPSLSEAEGTVSAQASKDMRRAVGQSWLTNRFGHPTRGTEQAKRVGQWAEERFAQHTALHQLGYVRRRFFGFALVMLASLIYAQTRLFIQETSERDAEAFVHDAQSEKLVMAGLLLAGAWLIPRAGDYWWLVVSVVALATYEVQLWGKPSGVDPHSSLARVYRLSELVLFVGLVCLNGCLDYLHCAAAVPPG